MSRGEFLPIFVLLAAIIVALTEVTRLFALWRRGAPIKSGWASLIGGIVKVPRRYMHDVHHVVSREPQSARMHALLAGGLLAALLLQILVWLLPTGRWTSGLVLLAVAVAFAGLALQHRRHAPQLSAHRSGGAYIHLSAFLALTLLYLALISLAALLPLSPSAALALNLSGSAAGAWGLIGLARTAARGPMRHAVAGTAVLATHPRPDRFGGGLSTGLWPANLNDPAPAKQTISDFEWPRLAMLDACVQCGRCEAVCPAFAAGAPLNPKKLINDLAGALHAPDGIAYDGAPHPGREVTMTGAGGNTPLVGDPASGAALASDTLWACTSCRACVYECPMMIEHVDVIIDLRRGEVLEKGAQPAAVAETLENVEMTDSPGGHDPSRRLDWAADLALPLLSDVGHADTLLWLGEMAYDLRGQRTLRALIRLLRRAGVDFAVLGQEERDCGDLARRLGDEATFQRLAQANIATLGRYDFRRIVTADPHAMHVLRREYKDFGGIYDVLHHSDILAELLDTGALVPPEKHGLQGTFTYHDPCYLSRYNGKISAPRAVLQSLGLNLREMERSGLRSNCCGGGGGAPVADIRSQQRIPDIRMEHARKTGAGCVVAACPNCTNMLEGVTQAPLEVQDLAELLNAAFEGASP